MFAELGDEVFVLFSWLAVVLFCFFYNCIQISYFGGICIVLGFLHFFDWIALLFQFEIFASFLIAELNVPNVPVFYEL